MGRTVVQIRRHTYKLCDNSIEPVMAKPEHERILRDAVRTGTSTIDMSGFDLSGLLFSSARLDGIVLSAADLRNARLSGGYFRGCDLRNAILKKADIVLGDFRDTNLQGTDLTSSDLNGAVMTGANLSNANLTKANLVKTCLDGADFTGTNLNQTDLRGAQGLTESQLESAKNSDKAILDERVLAILNRSGDITVARHGRRRRRRKNQYEIDLIFDTVKPTFGDIFLLSGHDHPEFPPTGDYGFDQLADLGVQQVDDYFAIFADGDPVVWLFPLVKGEVVEHHPGPFDGIRMELGDREHKELWANCVGRFKETLSVTQ